MLNTLINFLIIFAILIVINKFLILSKLILHNKNQSVHKTIGNSGIPISGGIFFFLIIIYIFFFKHTSFIDLALNIIAFGYFFYIGLLSDIGIEIKAKKRLFLQFLILFIFFGILKINIIKTNIDLLDILLGNTFFNHLFTVFCVLILINGLNFIDGVNLNSSGYLLSSYLILFFLNETLEEKYFFDQYLIIIIFSLVAFYILNSLEKNFLGDSGTYILGLLLGIDVINFCNFNNIVSPIIAINLLWYPAFENLFSIVRKFNSKNNPLYPDKKHLHTLIYIYLLRQGVKYPNTFTGLIINLTLVPSFVSILFFYDNSYKLFLIVIVYIVIYILSYLYINFRLNNEKNL